MAEIVGDASGMTFRRTTCPHCRSKLEAGQRIHPACIDGYAESEAAKAKRKAEKQTRMVAKVERATTRARRAALKRIPDLVREAQVVFNRWVRARDEKQPCISCGKAPGDMTELHAGRDAGHYRSTGAASHVRFHEDNVHAQCVSCNQWKAGNAVHYRLGLVERIGTARVEALEADNEPRKWTRDELIEIREKYKAKLKAMKETA